MVDEKDPLELEDDWATLGESPVAAPVPAPKPLAPPAASGKSPAASPATPSVKEALRAPSQPRGTGYSFVAPGRPSPPSRPGASDPTGDADSPRPPPVIPATTMAAGERAGVELVMASSQPKAIPAAPASQRVARPEPKTGFGLRPAVADPSSRQTKPGLEEPAKLPPKPPATATKAQPAAPVPVVAPAESEAVTSPAAAKEAPPLPAPKPAPQAIAQPAIAKPVIAKPASPGARLKPPPAPRLASPVPLAVPVIPAPEESFVETLESERPAAAAPTSNPIESEIQPLRPGLEAPSFSVSDETPLELEALPPAKEEPKAERARELPPAASETHSSDADFLKALSVDTYRPDTEASHALSFGAVEMAESESSSGSMNESEAQLLSEPVCAFYMGNDCYGLPIRFIGEVAPVSSLAPVPLARTEILGVFSLRGTPIPLIDIGTVLGFGAIAPSENALVFKHESLIFAVPATRIEMLGTNRRAVFRQAKEGEAGGVVSGFLELSEGKVVTLLSPEVLMAGINDLRRAPML